MIHNKVSIILIKTTKSGNLLTGYNVQKAIKKKSKNKMIAFFTPKKLYDE